MYRKQCQWIQSYVPKTVQNNVTNDNVPCPCVCYCRDFHLHELENKHFSGMSVGLQLRHGHGNRDRKSIRFKRSFYHICCSSSYKMLSRKRKLQRIIVVGKNGVSDLFTFRQWLQLMHYFRATEEIRMIRLIRDSEILKMRHGRDFLYIVLVCFHLLIYNHNLNDINFRTNYCCTKLKSSFILHQARKMCKYCKPLKLNILNNVKKHNALVTCQQNNRPNHLTYGTNLKERKNDIKKHLELSSPVTMKQLMISFFENLEIKNKENDIKNEVNKNYLQPIPQCLDVYPGLNDPGTFLNWGICLKIYFQESPRLQTFTKFPLTSPVSPVRLANEGFIYTPEIGFEDKVTCMFCRKSHKGWNHGDDVTEIHREISRNCPMAWGRECGNIPINNHTSGSEGSVNYLNRAENLAPAGESLNSSVQPDQLIASNGLSSHTAARPLSTPNRNLQLFDLFEVTQGNGNIIKCFYCGGQHGVSENLSNIWVEHASLFPECRYVRVMRGDNFVDAVLELLQNSNQVTEDMVRVHMNLPIALGASAPAPSRRQISLENFRPQENLADLMEEHLRLVWRILCQRCFIRCIEVVMIPCGHLATCEDCSLTLTSCYRCNCEATGFVKVLFG